MKKTFALLLALCLMLSGAALAEYDLTWEQVTASLEENNVNLSGEFYTFNEIAVAIFIPEGFTQVQAPNDTFIGYFMTEEGSAIGLQYVDANGMDLETYTAGLSGAGATEIETGTVNGLPCVSYEMPANKTVNVAFTTEAGYVLEVICGPMETEEDKQAASIIMASIQTVAE